MHLISFADIAKKYLAEKGYEPYICQAEDDARELANILPRKGKWPCLFTKSDTTGEKDFEEFFTDKECLDTARFENLGIIKNDPVFNETKLNKFTTSITAMRADLKWEKSQLVELFRYMIPDFEHKETGKYLDSKM